MSHAALARTLTSLGYPEPRLEYPVPGTSRKWRFDLAWPERRIAIEIQGGIWSRGRHTRGKGYANDCEKLNHSQLQGWKVFWTPTDWWESGEVFGLLERVFGETALQEAKA